MNVLPGYLKDYFAQPAAKLQFIIGTIPVGISYFIYYKILDTENLIRIYFGSVFSIFSYFVLFAGIYIFSWFIDHFFTGSDRKPDFWKFLVIVIPALIFLSINSSLFPAYMFIQYAAIEYQEYYITTRALVNLQSAFILGLPAAMVFIMKPQQCLKTFRRDTPYKEIILILLIMIPFLYLISVTGSGSGFYPSFNGLSRHYDMHQTVIRLIAYEITYLLQFISTEFFFRGILVIVLSSMIGTRAILPMAVLYAVWHLGKPLPELISSYFGGYLLGIFAMYARDMKIPILLHIGIAVLIEGLSFLNKLYLI